MTDLDWRDVLTHNNSTSPAKHSLKSPDRPRHQKRHRRPHSQEVTLRVPRLKTRHRHRVLFLQPAADSAAEYELSGRDASLFGLRRRGDGSGIWGLFYHRAVHSRGETHKVSVTAEDFKLRLKVVVV